MSRAIIDIESYLYRGAISCETLELISGRKYHTVYDLDKGIEYINTFISDTKKATGCDDYILVYSGSSNFRKILNPSYKSNRTSAPPTCFYELKDFIYHTHKVAYMDNLEADDTCRYVYEDGDKFRDVIVSIDKDLKTFQCRVYNPLKPELGIQKINKEIADANFNKQLIMGDKCDGYSGIKGYGEARANNLIVNGITEEDIISLYLENGHTIEDFEMVYNCAKIYGKESVMDRGVKLFGGKEYLW